MSRNGSLDFFFSAISADMAAVGSGGNATVEESIAELGPLHGVRADATFSEGLDSVECNVAVKIGELEFGPFPLCMVISREVMAMPSKMKMRLYPKPIGEIRYSRPCCVDFKPFLRELGTVDGKDEYETVRDMNYGSVEASVRETVHDSGRGECLVLWNGASRTFPRL